MWHFTVPVQYVNNFTTRTHTNLLGTFSEKYNYNLYWTPSSMFSLTGPSVLVALLTFPSCIKTVSSGIAVIVVSCCCCCCCEWWVEWWCSCCCWWWEWWWCGCCVFVVVIVVLETCPPWCATGTPCALSLTFSRSLSRSRSLCGAACDDTWWVAPLTFTPPPLTIGCCRLCLCGCCPCEATDARCWCDAACWDISPIFRFSSICDTHPSTGKLTLAFFPPPEPLDPDEATPLPPGPDKAPDPDNDFDVPLDPPPLLLLTRLLMEVLGFANWRFLWVLYATYGDWA